jgi:Tol biopolymer transport system component
MDIASGTTRRQIRPEQTIQDPALSPSADTIVYVRATGDYGGTVSELWLMDRDGSNPRTLYVPPADQSLLSRPAWSPDGQEIYFLQQGSGMDSRLLRLPVAGGEPAIVFTRCLDFALAPDGQWLVSASLDRKLTISGRDGNRLRDLEPQGIAFSDTYSLADSPDGQQLALRATETWGEDTWNLYLMDWSGRDVRRLTDLRGFHPFASSSGQVNGLSWTADGAHLVYSVDGHPDQSGIWRIGLDGGEPMRLFAWKEGEWVAVKGPWSEIGSLSSYLTEKEAEALLRDYSQALSSGQISHQAFYSPAMRDLIVERRDYYQEFLQVALHSDLLGIDSRYELRSVTPDAVEQGLYHVRAVEWVTLRGRYRQPTSEEYTPARAALWALARTDHPAVREALQDHLQREMASYLASLYIEDSYQMDWIVTHHLLVQQEADRFTIIQDTFDDRANDNPDGTDVVEWVDGQFLRRKPDLTLSPDYAIFHEPLETVEHLGQDLLRNYTRTYGGTPVLDLHPGWLTYTQTTYGFSFRYPPGWDVVNMPDVPNTIWLRHQGQSGLELSIGFRWTGEDVVIQRTSVGAGEVEMQGTVQFLGRELSRDRLSYERKVKAVMYNNAREIDVDGLIFTLSLDDRSRDYGVAEIMPETQTLVDEILTSFLLISE